MRDKYGEDGVKLLSYWELTVKKNGRLQKSQEVYMRGNVLKWESPQLVVGSGTPQNMERLSYHP